MEGPSLKIAAEQLSAFKNKKILNTSGNSKIGLERFSNQIVCDVFSWGKHLVIQFPDFALRTHFMLWGTYVAKVEAQTLTGDYEKRGTPRINCVFENGEFSFYNSSLKILETKNAKSEYDFSVDTMSFQWNENKAFVTTRNFPEEEIGDVLLDQTIFSGVGNIIRNEVLWIESVHPETKVKNISDKKLKEIISETTAFCFQFYEWRKQFILRKNLKVYRKSLCLRCQAKIERKTTGKRERKSYICPT
jgi:endonuclease-8